MTDAQPKRDLVAESFAELRRHFAPNGICCTYCGGWDQKGPDRCPICTYYERAADELAALHADYEQVLRTANANAEGRSACWDHVEALEVKCKMYQQSYKDIERAFIELKAQLDKAVAENERLKMYQQSYKDIERAFIELKAQRDKVVTALRAAHEWVAAVGVSEMPGVGDTQTELCRLLRDATEIREGERDE